jgi:integrase
MPTRRGNSEGTIIKRSDNRWEARIMLPDGKRKSFYAKTRQEAARRLAEALRDRDKGLAIVGEKQTLEQYLANWLNMIQPTVAPQTFKRYCDQVHLHIVPALGKVPIGRLAAHQVQALYSQKLQAGMAPGSVVLLNAVMHRALDAAQRLGLVQRNVTERADVPRKRAREDDSAARTGAGLADCGVGYSSGSFVCAGSHDRDAGRGAVGTEVARCRLGRRHASGPRDSVQTRRKVSICPA